MSNKSHPNYGRISTEAQTQAQQENYALFQLKGMLGNLAHVVKVTNVEHLAYEIKKAISSIKIQQYIRQKDRKQNETDR